MKSRQHLSIEPLERRDLLTSTIYLDFAQSIGVGNIYGPTTVGELAQIDGPGLSPHQAGTGTDLKNALREATGGQPSEIDDDYQIRFSPLSYDYNGDGVADNNDLDEISDAVLPLVKQIFTPFDIDVQAIDSATFDFSTIVDTLRLNDSETDGKFDAYIVVSNVEWKTEKQATNGWRNVGTEPYIYNGVNQNVRWRGYAAIDDLYWQNGNKQDEVALVFTDGVQEATTAAHTPGTPGYNALLIQHLASVAAHEAMHTFAGIHTNDGYDPEFYWHPAHSDLIYQNVAIVPEIPMVTRYPYFAHESLSGVSLAEPNSFDLLYYDDDIGFRDEGPSGIPNDKADIAYVTGTGGSDIITITRESESGVRVVLRPFWEERSGGTKLEIQTYDYTIDLDTFDGLIVVDGGRGNDQIFVDDDIPVDFRIRFDVGDDVLQVVETGNPQIGTIHVSGGPGNDVLSGGPSGDILDGGEGADTLAGGEGADEYQVKGAPGGSPDRDTLIDAVIVEAYGVGANANTIKYEGTGYVDIEFSYDPDPFDGVAEIKTFEFEAYAVDGRTTTMATQVIDELFDVVQSSGTDPQWDIDGDGDIDGFLTSGLAGQAAITNDHSDIDYFVLKVLGTNYGDANLDGKVDAIDLNILGDNWQEQWGMILSSWGLADFNGDGKIDAADLNIMGQQWLWWNVVANA